MTEMLKDEASRTKFVNDSVQFLRKFEFDGLDLDFECMFIFNPIISYYFFLLVFIDPGVNHTETNRISPPEDKQRFTELCKV
jgi:hypothetical protein